MLDPQLGRLTTSPHPLPGNCCPTLLPSAGGLGEGRVRERCRGGQLGAWCGYSRVHASLRSRAHPRAPWGGCQCLGSHCPRPPPPCSAGQAPECKTRADAFRRSVPGGRRISQTRKDLACTRLPQLGGRWTRAAQCKETGDRNIGTAHLRRPSRVTGGARIPPLGRGGGVVVMNHISPRGSGIWVRLPPGPTQGDV